MIFSEFNSIVAQALTPITLISGVGILMLCMTARYNHATERIRQLMEKREASGTTVEPDIDAEIDLIFHRAALLRSATISVVLSAFCSGLMVLAGVLSGVLSGILDVSLVGLQSALLVSAIFCIVVSTLFFSAEVTVSLHALGLVVEHLPENEPAADKAA